jgi:hypothetical protein
MKKRIFSSILIVAFAWVAVGALDCGCVYASPLEQSMHERSKTSEMVDCHGSEEADSKKTEDPCCAGCQLESKAPAPPTIQWSHPISNQFSNLILNTFQWGAISVPSAVSSQDFPIFQIEQAQSVSFYGTPIYLTVQSLLI